MSLFGALQLASNSLQANQIALQTVSQNISNANTPGYARADVNFVPAPTQKLGGVLLGLGVLVSGVTQHVDNYLEQRLRGAASDRANSDIQASTYQDLEGALNVLSDDSVNSSINKFFASINDVINQPESASIRNIAILNGKKLATDINNLSAKVGDLHKQIDDQVKGTVSDANRLIEQIRKLNVQISSLEAGGAIKSDAIGLRDQRRQALSDLSEIMNITVSDQESSSANVYVNGEYLVFEGTSRTLTTETQVINGQYVTTAQIADTKSPLATSGGKLAGLVSARDDILGGFQTQLDGFTATFANEFNKLYASGQGLKGYSSLTSVNGVQDVGASLESAGLPNTPVSGSFQVLVKNTTTGVTQTQTINIDLNGIGNDDTSLTKIRQQIDAIDGISASLTPAGKLQIVSDSPNVQFAFANDTTGTLAALGINTFFTGNSASTLAVNTVVSGDPQLFAAASNGIGQGAGNAIQLAGFLDKPLDAFNGATILDLRDKIVSEVSQSSAARSAITDGFKSYEGTLLGKQLAVSGVNIDEEAVKLMAYQRAFQASAKFIATINELLDTVVNL